MLEDRERSPANGLREVRPGSGKCGVERGWWGGPACTPPSGTHWVEHFVKLANVLYALRETFFALCPGPFGCSTTRPHADLIHHSLPSP